MKTKNIVIIGLIVITNIVACKKDDTTPTTPSTGITRNDYFGSWSCTEIPVAKNQYFDCTISADANVINNIKITNFANLNGTAFAIVNGKSVVLPVQTISNNTFEGYGTLDNSKNLITWHYYVKTNTDSTVCNTTFNRK